MSIKCIIGLHSWDGCKCSDCDKIRDKQHDYSINCEQCSKCGTTRENQHKGNGLYCSKCGNLTQLKLPSILSQDTIDRLFKESGSGMLEADKNIPFTFPQIEFTQVQWDIMRKESEAYRDCPECLNSEDKKHIWKNLEIEFRITVGYSNSKRKLKVYFKKCEKCGRTIDPKGWVLSKKLANCKTVNGIGQLCNSCKTLSSHNFSLVIYEFTIESTRDRYDQFKVSIRRTTC